MNWAGNNNEEKDLKIKNYDVNSSQFIINHRWNSRDGEKRENEWKFKRKSDIERMRITRNKSRTNE